jgi:MFS family permease
VAADRRSAGLLIGDRAGTAVVAAAAVCVGVGGFDLGAVNVVLPDLAAAFGVSPAAVQWVAIAYLLPIAALALPTGRWLDTVGRRPAMLLLVGGFTVCSVLAALAPALAPLVAARVAQGAFGAGLFAICPALAYEGWLRNDGSARSRSSRPSVPRAASRARRSVPSSPSSPDGRGCSS